MTLVRLLLLGIALTVVPAVTSAPAAAQGQDVSREAELKGKMVGLLGKMVTWPPDKAPSPTNPLTIGIVGDNPFVDDHGVNHLARKVPKAKILRFATAEEFEDCHILVVSKNADFKKALEKTQNKSILVVSESPGLARQGAVTNLVFDRNANEIRLEINPTTARRLKLEVNRDLLRSPLVDIVRADG